MTNTAAPASTPASTSRAVATTAQPQTALDIAQDVRLLQLATRDDVERFETVVTIPADYQYAIPVRGVRNPDGSWDNSRAKIGLLSDAYDYLNRVVGVTFFMPKTVFDQDGNERPNPIHRRDYILLRLGGVWYNPMGQLTAAIEDIEVDFNLMYVAKLAESKDAVPVMQNGQLQWDEAGNPMLTVPAADQMKALRQLTSMRAFGLRYPFTVARTRIMKLATGIRSLPGNETRPFQLRVVGFRDKMTPEQRIASVADDVAEMFGQRPTGTDGSTIKPLTDDEMAEVSEPGSEEAADTLAELGQDEAAAGQHAKTTVPTSATPREGNAAAAVGSIICGQPTVAKVDEAGNEVQPPVMETCLVVLDAEGKHVGPHKSASGSVPQAA